MQKLFHEFIFWFGFLKRICYYSQKWFSNNLSKELQGLWEVSMSNTTLFHPMMNSQLKHINGIFINMQRSLRDEKTEVWENNLLIWIWADKSTIFKSHMMFGRIFWFICWLNFVGIIVANPFQIHAITNGRMLFKWAT